MLGVDILTSGGLVDSVDDRQYYCCCDKLTPRKANLEESEASVAATVASNCDPAFVLPVILFSRMTESTHNYLVRFIIFVRRGDERS